MRVDDNLAITGRFEIGFLFAQQSFSHDRSAPWWLHHTHALMCDPKVYKGNGTVELLAMEPESRLRDAEVHRFLSHKEEMLNSDLASTFSKTLFNSVQTINDTSDGLYSSLPILSGYFSGDFLSYLSFRWSAAHGIHLNQDNYAAVASHIFSTVFATTVLKTGFLNVPTDQVAVILPTNFEYKLEFRKFVCIYLIATAIGYVLTVFYFGLGLLWQKEYMFPLDPVPLENSWYFLYNSSLPQKFQKIKEPESLGLDELYKSVDRLKLTYFFGRPSKDVPFTEARVDISSLLEDPPPAKSQHQSRQTRFFDVESSSSDSDSSDSSVEERDRRDRKRRRRNAKAQSRQPVQPESPENGQNSLTLDEMEIENNDQIVDESMPRWRVPYRGNARRAKYLSRSLYHRRITYRAAAQQAIAPITRSYDAIVKLLGPLPSVKHFRSPKQAEREDTLIELLNSLPNTSHLPDPTEQHSSSENESTFQRNFLDESEGNANSSDLSNDNDLVDFLADEIAPDEEQHESGLTPPNPTSLCTEAVSNYHDEYSIDNDLIDF
jgi:hypothetical protein